MYEAHAQTPVYTFFIVLVYRRCFIFLKRQSLRMDLICRGSKKYFALMLYRLFSAGIEEELNGKVN